MRVGATILVALAFVLGAPIASADSADLSNGVFIAHAPSTLQYTTNPPSGSWCSEYTQNYAITSCEDQDNEIDSEGMAVWYVLCAWTESKTWCGTEFGLGDYDEESFLILEHGPCFPGSGLTIPTSGWPGPSEGIALTTTDTAWSGNLQPVYWFAGYAYSEDVVPLSPDPANGFGGWARCEDQQVFEADDFGAMGLLTDGTYACPEGGLDGGGDGADGQEGADGEDGAGEPEVPGEPDVPEDDSPGGLVDAPYLPPENPSATVSAYIYPWAIDFGDRGAVLPIDQVSFNDSVLRASLLSVGALTIAPEYPQASLADTLGRDTNGRSVQRPDISGFFHIEFEDPETAIEAIPSLRRTSGIRSAEVLSATLAEVTTTFPEDPYFESWRTFTEDAQWFLQNDGARYDSLCGSAVAGGDIKVQGGWAHGLGDSATVIGIVDTGVLGGRQEYPGCHEDLRVVPLSYAQRDSISHHPSYDWCYSHGTRMSGISAARTNNALGVAGVCGHCSILDIESSWCSPADCAQGQSVICRNIAYWQQNIAGALALSLPDPRSFEF